MVVAICEVAKVLVVLYKIPIETISAVKGINKERLTVYIHGNLRYAPTHRGQ